MTDLSQLIERVQAATEGSRELDAEIAAILRMCPIDEDWVRNWTGEWRAINGLVHLIGDYGSSGNFRPREYTTSLDAALTLLPGGIQLDLTLREGGTGYACAWTHHGNRSSNGATLTLAALSAILKARQAAGRAS